MSNLNVTPVLRYVLLGFFCVAVAMTAAVGINEYSNRPLEGVSRGAGPRGLGMQIPADVSDFRPVTVIPDRFDTIQNVPLMTAAEANDKLHEDELVIGLTIGGESRAYPINMLTGPSREIINDTLGGQAIAATW